MTKVIQNVLLLKQFFKEKKAGRYSVLFKTTAYKSVEKNRKSRNKSAHGHSIFNEGTKIIQWEKVF